MAAARGLGPRNRSMFTRRPFPLVSGAAGHETIPDPLSLLGVGSGHETELSLLLTCRLGSGAGTQTRV